MTRLSQTWFTSSSSVLGWIARVAILVSAVPSTCAYAATSNVAIVAAATNSNIMSNRFTDLRDVLVADGRFNTVDIISTTRFGSGTPSLNDLLQYDAVIHWANDSNDDAVALGNVFADYVDTGGGMVQAVFANTSSNSARFLQGRWLTGDYNIIPPNGGFTQGTTISGAATQHAVMDAPIEPEHPIFDGVSDVRLALGMFDTGGLWGAYRPTTTAMSNGGRKLALWEDGKTAVAVSDIFPNRVELGLHPVSNLVADGYYELNSDTSILIANALLFSAGEMNDLSFDINGNGGVDCADVNTLSMAIANGAFADNLDFDGDTDLDLDDLDAWLTGAAEANGLPAPYLPGDADLSGNVNGVDFAIWSQHKFSENSAWCDGDFDADGQIGAADFLIWNQSKSVPAAKSPVPEPVSPSWPLVLLTFIAARQRGKRTTAHRTVRVCGSRQF